MQRVQQRVYCELLCCERLLCCVYSAVVRDAISSNSVVISAAISSACKTKHHTSHFDIPSSCVCCVCACVTSSVLKLKHCGGAPFALGLQYNLKSPPAHSNLTI